MMISWEVKQIPPMAMIHVISLYWIKSSLWLQLKAGGSISIKENDIIKEVFS